MVEKVDQSTYEKKKSMLRKLVVCVVSIFLLSPVLSSAVPANTIIATIPVGLNPTGIAITPDGLFAYVANTNSNAIPYADSVTVIDLTTNTVVTTIHDASFDQPYSVTINIDGTLAYITNSNSTTITIINIPANTVAGVITGLDHPAGMVLTGDGSTADVANLGSYVYETLISVIDLNIPAIIATLILDMSTAEFAATMLPLMASETATAPNGLYAYRTNSTTNTVSVIALQTFQITAQGSKTQRTYFLQTDHINQLTWTVTGISLPVSYSIYRDAALTDLAGTVLASAPALFLDHGRNPNITYTYYIVGTNSVGTTSVPVVVTVM